MKPRLAAPLTRWNLRLAARRVHCAPRDDIVEVDFKTTNEGTATEGVDFRKLRYTLFFFPGETTCGMTVWLVNDSLNDDGETMIVRLTGARLPHPRSGDVKGPVDLSDDADQGEARSRSYPPTQRHE